MEVANVLFTAFVSVAGAGVGVGVAGIVMQVKLWKLDHLSHRIGLIVSKGGGVTMMGVLLEALTRNGLNGPATVEGWAFLAGMMAYTGGLGLLVKNDIEKLALTEAKKSVEEKLNASP